MRSSFLLLSVPVMAAILFLGGCGAERSDAPADSPAAQEAPLSVEDARKLVAKRESELALAKVQLKDATAARTATYCYLTAGILAALAVLASVAAWFVPIYRLRFVLAAGGLLAAAAMAYWLGGRVWVIPWLGGALVVALLLGLISALRRAHTGLSLTAQYADMIERCGDKATRTATKAAAAAAQARAGVRGLVARIRGKPSPNKP